MSKSGSRDFVTSIRSVGQRLCLGMCEQVPVIYRKPDVQEMTRRLIIMTATGFVERPLMADTLKTLDLQKNA